MGKAIIIVLFLVTFGAAVYQFANREPDNARALVDAPTKDPSLWVEGFLLRRYDGAVLSEQLSAKEGRFVEPNTVALEGAVHGERKNATSKEDLIADHAVAQLTAHNMRELMEDAHIVKADFTGHVIASFSDNVLQTDAATFIAKEDQISSVLPVRVQGPNRWFTGDQGFRYDLASQDLQVMGNIKGSVLPPSKSR